MGLFSALRTTLPNETVGKVDDGFGFAELGVLRVAEVPIVEWSAFVGADLFTPRIANDVRSFFYILNI